MFIHYAACASDFLRNRLSGSDFLSTHMVMSFGASCCEICHNWMKDPKSRFLGIQGAGVNAYYSAKACYYQKSHKYRFFVIKSQTFDKWRGFS